MADLDKIDGWFNTTFQPISDAAVSTVFFAVPIGGGQEVPLILLWLVAASVFCTIYFGFINIRFFKHGYDVLRGKFDHDGDQGQINRFQALTTTMSGTVGLGNIAGVAVAVSVGGPGAVLWMILMGLFGMSTKFLEASLGVKYRHANEDGVFYGGPMYYLRDGFAKRGWTKTGAWLGAIFAICCIGGTFGAGNMFQANQAYQQFVNVTGGETGLGADRGWLFGLFLACFIGAVIIGGIKSISAVASKIVPLMGGIYMLAGLIIVGMNIDQLPMAFGEIFSSAFSMEAGIGGLLGAFIQGVQRAAFSNEAGIGSGGIAHAVVKTNQPVSQGFVAMLGPFIDTVVICLMTALVIVVTGVYNDYDQGMAGIELTSQAFGSEISWFPYVLALTVILFAFSTMIAWCYYGLKGVSYLFGENKKVAMGFKISYCLFAIVGATADLKTVINFTDAMVFAMAVPNIIALYFFAPEIKRDLKAYLADLKENQKDRG